MFNLSAYGKKQWISVLIIGLILVIVPPCISLKLWWLSLVFLVTTYCGLAFFRDPYREIPSHRDAYVSPADGKVTSIHEVADFEPFGEPAVCVRIFLSVLNVHINRSSCHGIVTSVTHRPGKFMNALNPESAEVNEAMLINLVHPTQKYPVAAIRQVAGAIARRIICGVKEGDTLQRGQRFGLICFGSTTELYIPKAMGPRLEVKVGQIVRGGTTIICHTLGRNTPDGQQSNAEDGKPSEQTEMVNSESETSAT